MRKFMHRAAHGVVLLMLWPGWLPAHEPVTVTVGRPNVWSLEQAHYLLSRMHAENLNLQTPTPGQEDLDLNRIHSRRLEALQTLLDVGVKFDQATALQQSVERKEFEAVTSRRVQIRRRLNRLHEDKVEASLDVTRLSGQPNQTDALAERQTDLALIDEEIRLLNAELESLNTTPALTASPDAADTGLTLPASSLDNLLGNATDFSPQLHASTVLDNYIQMQYEIIAKQVSLLKDEVGPDKRLLFLELPVSIYSVPGKGKKRLVEARWEILETCRLPVNFRDDLQQMLYQQAGKAPKIKNVPQLPLLSDEWLLKLCTPPDSKRPVMRSKPALLLQAARDEDSDAFWHEVQKMISSRGADLWEPIGSEGSVFVADLVPRQAALNVNQIHKNSRRRGIAGAASFLFGLSGKVRYQRQKETFAQFVHQDTFASGFGKGEHEFGWTFGPLPGTKLIAPGTRTTYAVVVVPRDTVALKLQAWGHGYKRKKHPDRTRPQPLSAFDVPLPRVDEGFYITEVNYTSVPAGERVMVELEGTYFSPQVGVMINGVPLRRVVSIARPELAPRRDTSPPAVDEQAIRGEFELVNPREIKMVFSMGEDYEGTPVISLVTPQKATPINDFWLEINHVKTKRQLSWISSKEPMFAKPLELESLSFFGSRTKFHDCPAPHTEEFAVLHLDGTGFRDDAFITLNGALPRGGHKYFRSSGRYELHIPTRHVDWSANWQITVSQNGSQHNEVATKTFPNPCVPRIGEAQVLHHRTGGESTESVTEVMIPLQGHLTKGPVYVSYPDQDRAPCCKATTLSCQDKKGLECRQISRDQVWVRTTSSKNPLTLRFFWPHTDKDHSSLVTIVRPEAPTIRKLHKKEGLITGGETVQVHGHHLGHVTRVLFGDNAASILTREPGLLTVKAPPGAEGSVQVRLLTDLEYGGQMLTNGKDLLGSAAYYTYKKPKEKKDKKEG